MVFKNKYLFIALAMCVAAFAAHAQDKERVVLGFSGHMLPPDDSLSPAATYTPPQFKTVAAAHGWIELEDAEDSRWWLAYQDDARRPNIIHVAIKRAMKGAGQGFTEIQILDGEAICPAGDVGPNYLHNLMLASYDSRGVPTGGGMLGPTLTLVRGSVLAEGAAEACAHRGGREGNNENSTAQVDFKPEAKFPPQAIRLKHQGVVVVGYKVGPNGSVGRDSVWIEKSSGYPELDRSALETVSTWRIVTKPVGTSASTDITFSLNRI